MREILFRGKRTDNGDWVVDNSVLFFRNSTKIYGVMNGWREIEVIPDTVGQYTGLTDKNGTKIFEGDIVTYEDAVADYEGYRDDVFLNRGEVELSAWDGTCFTNRQTVEMDDLYESETTVDCEVVGNIYDNPELLRSEKE